MSKSCYFTVIAEVDTHQMTDSLYSSFLHSIDRINETWKSSLAAPASANGNQCVLLFSSGKNLVDVVVFFADSVDSEFRFGIGYGGLSTRIKMQVGQMDGPCFRLAREALRRAFKFNRWVIFSGLDSPSNLIISASFNLMASIRHGWTKKQKLYFNAARTNKQNAVASMFGIRPSVVCESLKAACSADILEAEEAIRSYLETF